MAGIDSDSFDQPDELELRTKPRWRSRPSETRRRSLHLRAGMAVVGVHQAGGGNGVLPNRLCRLRDFGCLGVAHEDGSQVTLSAGDAYRIAPGHDAWVDGDEEFVGFEFKGAAT